MYGDSPKKFSFNVDDPSQGTPPVAVNIPNFPGPSTAGLAPQERIQRIRKLLRIVKWCTFPLILIQLLFIWPKAYPLLVTMVFPILGFVAAIRYSEYLTKLYSIYLILLIFIQIINMIILQGAGYIVLQCLFMVFELYVAILCIKVSLVMKKLTSEEWKCLQDS